MPSNLKLIDTLRKVVLELWKAVPVETSIFSAILIIQGVVPSIILLLTKVTLDGVNDFLKGSDVSITIILVGWACTLLINTLLSPISQIFQGNIAEKFTAHVHIRLMEKAESLLGLEAMEDQRFHDDLNILRTGANSRPLNVFTMLMAASRELITILGLLLTLSIVGWWVPFAIILSAYPLAAASLKLREMSWRALLRNTPEARSMEYDSGVALNIENAAEVRLYNLIGWLKVRYKRTFAISHQVMRDVRKAQAFRIIPLSLLGICTSIGLLLWAINQAAQGIVSIGSIAIVITGLAQAQQAIFNLIEASGILVERGFYFQKYYEFLGLIPSVVLAEKPIPVSARPPNVRFDNVSFSYPDGRAALRDISFEIRSGETIAIVGENGAGKTTLVKLILRFYDCTTGQIKIDGVDLKDLALPQWRNIIGGVFQNFGRYAYDLEDNIKLGEPEDTSTSRFSEAVKRSGVSSFVDSLKDGRKTRLSKAFGGTDLSGGQWQKIAVARALYRNSSLLILDEPSSALDPRSEHELFQKFAELAERRTAILITHRLGSVRVADRILVIKDGRLVEEGTHTELLNLGGEYKELWSMQSSSYQAA